mgnify:CR=1 FL=1|jgi:Transcriptional regulators
MSSPNAPFDLPQRFPLSVQAAGLIKKAFEDGTWGEHLPSERRLCEIFRVSRPTIRAALLLLVKEGILETHPGRRKRLLKSSQKKPHQQNKMVGLVAHVPMTHVALAAYESISEMRAHLAEQGFTTDVLICPTHSPRVQRRKLEEFVRRNRVFCCVLLSVSREIQEWFSQNSVPALVLGSCHAKTKLPSLDVDHRSVCRHAAGIFLGKGHRRLALIVPNSGLAGDLASEEGFREAVAQRADADDTQAIIVRHNSTAPSIIAKLDALFDSPRPPTALLVARARHVFVVIIYLLKRGLTVPDTVSLIARDHDPLFEFVSPAINHYRFEEGSFAPRLSRLMLQMVSQGYLPSEPNLMFPDYFPGGTVKQLR